MCWHASAGGQSLTEVIERPAAPATALPDLPPTRKTPCSLGSTTGVPKLIPRTHNDYAYNSRPPRVRVTGVPVLLLMLPIAHNLPLCQAFRTYFNGGAGHYQSTRPEEVFHGCAASVTHIRWCPRC